MMTTPMNMDRKSELLPYETPTIESVRLEADHVNGPTANMIVPS